VLSSACRSNGAGRRCCQKIVKIVSTANEQAKGIVGLAIASYVSQLIRWVRSGIDTWL
jgi:hypothetical protein